MFGKRKPKTPDFPDIASRTPANELAPDYLDGVESDLHGFGTSGGRGFADAWDDADTAQAKERGAAPGSDFGSDEADSKGRSLDRRSRRGVVILGLIVVVGIGLGMAVQRGVLNANAQSSDASIERTGLLAPGVARDYESEPTSIVLSSVFEIDDSFRAIAGADPDPVGAVATAPIPDDLHAGPVVWAGRTHIAVGGTGLGSAELCTIVSLVTVDLVVIDLAAVGACPAAFDETGDRLACRGDDLLMLETWSTNPNSTAPKPVVSAIRVRVEQTSNDGIVISRRGSFDLAGGATPMIDASAFLGGAPGDTATIGRSTSSASRLKCTLLDRDDVAVRLLPS